MRRRGKFLASLAAAAALSIRAQAEPAMWVIRDHDSTIYLLGTVHILRPETLWNVPRIKQAVAESSELWLEMIIDHSGDGGLNLLNKYGIDPAPPLSKRLTPAQRERLAKVADQYTFPVALIDKMQPWYASMTLMMMPLLKAGYNPNAGVEELLEVEARLEGDRVIGFETMEEQLKILSGLPEKDQIDLLMQTLDDAEGGVAELDKLAQAWSAGDIETMQSAFLDEFKSEAPVAYQRLLVERNIRWSHRIEKMLHRSGVQMIAVGAAHLIGPDSVQVQLEKLGIKAERY